MTPHRRVPRVFGGLVALAAFSPITFSAVLKGPFVLLEQRDILSLRLEVDRPEARVVLLHGEAGRADMLPEFIRSPRDTFLARVRVELRSIIGFRGYEIWQEGRLVGTYDWRSRIGGTLEGYPRLLVFGDSQGGKHTTAKLGQQWRNEQFDLAVGLGDLTDAGSRYESWEEEFFGPLKDFLPHHPLIVVAGNHEPYRERSFAWFDWFFQRDDGRRYFAIDFGDLRLIGINNADLHSKYGVDRLDPLTPQYEFLRDSLLAAGAAERKAVVFAHVPPFSGSTVVNREFGSELQRRYIVPLLERARVLGFFAGHHHKYERLLRTGLRGATQYFVTGGAGGRLFTSERDRGGWKMDREVFEQYHYLTVDFGGTGMVVARSIDGEEIDRASFGPVAPGDEARGSLAIWSASLGAEFSTPPAGPHAGAIRLRPPPEVPLAEPPRADLYQTTGGLVAVARNLRAAADPGLFSLQGYDARLRFWGFLQGAIMAFGADGVRGSLALVALNGAELSPLDRIFPVMHWPVAASRAGITDQAGAVLLLRGTASFDLDPAPGRVLARWRWGALPRNSVAPGQAARQWSVLEEASTPITIGGDAAAGLLGLVRELRPECFVVRRKKGGPAAGTVVYWPGGGFVAIAPGESLAAQRGAIFVRVTSETEVIADWDRGLPGVRLRAVDRPEIFVPLAPFPP